MAASDITVAGLAATGDVKGIKLAWTYNDPRNNALPNIGLDMVEVWASTTNDRATAAKVGQGITDFLHAGLSRGDVRYYWIKARDNIGGFGPWYPSSPTAGVVGTEVSGDVLIAQNGYWKHPSGLIEQWGRNSLVGGGQPRLLSRSLFQTSVSKSSPARSHRQVRLSSMQSRSRLSTPPPWL